MTSPCSTLALTTLTALALATTLPHAAHAQSLTPAGGVLAVVGAASSGPVPALVTPADTFSFDIAGFNSNSGVGYLLTPQETATFGVPMTFTAAGINGQDITITSGETIGATTTTDTFTVSTPTNFLTTTTVNGTTITALQFDIGNSNSGSNPVNVLLPISSYTAAGNILYGASNTSFTLTPATTLGTNNLSYAASEGVNTGTSAISTIAVHSFTYSITYLTAAPEPSPFAAFGIGLLGLATLALKARKRQVA